MNRSMRMMAGGVALAWLSLIAQAAGAANSTGGADDSGWFVGAGVGSMPFKVDGSSQAVGIAYVQAGWEFNQYFAIDARVGAGNHSGFEFDFGGVSLKTKSLYAIYARGTWPVTSTWDLYTEAGFAGMKLKASAFGESATESDQSFSYGLGASWKPLPQFALYLEYQPTVVKGPDWKTSALNLGMRWKF